MWNCDHCTKSSKVLGNYQILGGLSCIVLFGVYDGRGMLGCSTVISAVSSSGCVCGVYLWCCWLLLVLSWVLFVPFFLFHVLLSVVFLCTSSVFCVLWIKFTYKKIIKFNWIWPNTDFAYALVGWRSIGWRICICCLVHIQGNIFHYVFPNMRHCTFADPVALLGLAGLKTMRWCITFFVFIYPKFFIIQFKPPCIFT